MEKLILITEKRDSPWKGVEKRRWEMNNVAIEALILDGVWEMKNDFPIK